ncbi:MAG: iron chelate uptake ABC transporter family permease subunit [Verrucomicrobiota bacterium]
MPHAEAGFPVLALASQNEALSWPLFWEVFSLQTYNTRLVVVSAALLGLASGLVGTFLLLRKRSLVGDALSHATLPGIGLAFLLATSLGWEAKALPVLLTGAALTGIVGFLIVLAIRNTTRLKDDAAMGLVLSVFFGGGIVLLSMAQTLPQAAGLESFIYGKAASMVPSDFFLIASFTVAAAAAAFLLQKEFTLLCFDEPFASAQGWPTRRLDVLLLLLVTAVTVVGLQAVGLILVIAFLITPATAARFWTHSLPKMLWLSGLLGAASGWLGATLSALLPGLPAGAVIVLAAAFLFLLSLFFGTARGVLPRRVQSLRLNRKVGRQHLLRAFYEILERRHPAAQSLQPNEAIRLRDLQGHRSWPPRQLQRLLRQAQQEDHLEESQDRDWLRLSESGFGEAARITRNHRLWETYLIHHADIAPSHVDRDADMIEHVLDADLVQRLETELRSRGAWIPSPHLLSGQ